MQGRNLFLLECRHLLLEVVGFEPGGDFVESELWVLLDHELVVASFVHAQPALLIEVDA